MGLLKFWNEKVLYETIVGIDPDDPIDEPHLEALFNDYRMGDCSLCCYILQKNGCHTCDPLGKEEDVHYRIHPLLINYLRKECKYEITIPCQKLEICL